MRKWARPFGDDTVEDVFSNSCLLGRAPRPGSKLPQNLGDIRRAIGEFFSRLGQLIGNGDKQVRKRNIIAVVQMSSMLETHVFSATENNGVIGCPMRLAGGAAVETKRVV